MVKPSVAKSAETAKSKSPQTSGKLKVSQEPTLSANREAKSTLLEPTGVREVTPEVSPLGSVEAPHIPFGNEKGVQEESFGPLPASYHQDALFLTARDPRWLFCYWDFQWDRVSGEDMREGRRAYFLRVIRAGGQVEALVEINPAARNWYVPVSHADASYVSELGYFNRKGGWQRLLESGEARTPADALATNVQEERFATVPPELSFERLQELVEGHMEEGESLLEAVARIAGGGSLRVRSGSAPVWTEEQKRLLAMLVGESLVEVLGMGSDEIDRLLRKALQQKLHSETASGLSAPGLLELGPSSLFSLSSPIGASWSTQPFGKSKERGFFMHLNAEVIFYGGTAPDARVTVNGERVDLKPDGSFRFHFTLPDGDFEIPIAAVSSDGQEERSGTLSFRRQTRRVGAVGMTSQPQHLEPLIGRRSA